MPISALAYISYLLYPNYQCAKHTAVIYALKEMFSSHQDLTLEVGGYYGSICATDFGLLVPPFSVQMMPLTFLSLGLLKDHLQS